MIQKSPFLGVAERESKPVSNSYLYFRLQDREKICSSKDYCRLDSQEIGYVFFFLSASVLRAGFARGC